MKKIYPLALMLVSIASASAFDFTYNINEQQGVGFGYGRLDTYDVCVRLDKQTFIDSKVIGFEVDVPQVDGCSVAPEVTGWAATSLAAEGEEQKGDLAQISATTDGKKIKITFAEPVDYPTDGMYVGYTLTVTELKNWTQKYPVDIVYGNTDGSLWMRSSSRQPKWVDGAAAGRMSTMTVNMTTEIPEVGAQIGLDLAPFGPVGGEAPVYATIENHGLSEIKEMEYSYSYGAACGTGNITLTRPIAAKFGAKGAVQFSIPAGNEVKDEYCKITIEKINGKDNSDYGRSDVAVLRTVPFVPVNRPLVEEYTGLWCHGCPAGWVALEEGKAAYGSDFVAISFHTNDDMQTYHRFPQKITGYPSMFFNRGTTRVNLTNTLDQWDVARRELAPAEVEVEIEWVDDAKTQLRAISKTRFVDDATDVDYRLAYALVADGLTDPDWLQQSDYGGRTDLTGPFWDYFTKGNGGVRGLYYNDIMCIYDDCMGVEQSLPTEVESGKVYEHQYVFTLADAMSSRGKNIIREFGDIGKLRVVAAVLDAKSNKALNSVSSTYSSGAPVSSVGSVTDELEVVATSWYNLSGLRINAPADECHPGEPCIRVDVMSDGTTRASKLF